MAERRHDAPRSDQKQPATHHDEECFVDAANASKTSVTVFPRKRGFDGRDEAVLEIDLNLVRWDTPFIFVASLDMLHTITVICVEVSTDFWVYVADARSRLQDKISYATG